jgi:cadmium resistance transport/sequestration family protein
MNSLPLLPLSLSKDNRIYSGSSMNGFTTALITGITAFAATNIDDIVLLTFFFAQAKAPSRPIQVVLGQYLGFMILILASLPGYLGGLVISKPWLGLLGLLPIAIGISQILKSESEQKMVQTLSDEWKQTATPWGFNFNRLLARQTYSFAAVTVANGGDNIGIYVPLFANSNLVSLGIILSTFVVMIAVWCGIAYLLAQHPAIAHTVANYGHKIVPLVLISLGVFILIESRTYQLLKVQSAILAATCDQFGSHF